MVNLIKTTVLVFVLVNIGSCETLTPDKQHVKGRLKYYSTAKSAEALTHQIEYHAKYNIYEPTNKKLLIYTGPKIQKDYDHFKGEINVSIYNTLGLEF